MTGEFNLAVHALVFLHRMQQTVCSDTLARSTCTNPARVRKVMSRLKAAGLIGAKEGPEGGYYLVRKAQDITLDMLLDALHIRLVTPTWHSAEADLQCVIASGMAGVMDDLLDMLNNSCRERLGRISILEVDSKIPPMPNKALHTNLQEQDIV